MGSQERKDKVVVAGAITKLAALLKCPPRIHTSVAKSYLAIRVQAGVTLQSLAHERPNDVQLMIAEVGIVGDVKEVMRLCSKGSGSFSFTKSTTLPAGIEQRDINAVHALHTTLKSAAAAVVAAETPSRMPKLPSFAAVSNAAKRVAGSVADTAKAAAGSAKAAAAGVSTTSASSSEQPAGAGASGGSTSAATIGGAGGGGGGRASAAAPVPAMPSRRSWLPFGQSSAEKAAAKEAAAAAAKAVAEANKKPKFTGPMPVLDTKDPQEKILRRVTEQTLRKEFRSSGGECTPIQIADRFKDQLNDPSYGLENRVRFRDVIDRIARPMMVQEQDGTMVQKLVLRPEYGGKTTQQDTPMPISAAAKAKAKGVASSPARPPSEAEHQRRKGGSGSSGGRKVLPRVPASASAGDIGMAAAMSDDVVVAPKKNKKDKKKKKRAKVAKMVGDEEEADAAVAAANAILVQSQSQSGAASPPRPSSTAAAAAAFKMAAASADEPAMSPESRQAALLSSSEKIKHFYANAAPSSSVPRAQAAAVLSMRTPTATAGMTPLLATAKAGTEPPQSPQSPEADDEAATKAKEDRQTKLQASSDRIKQFYAKHMPDKYADKFGEPLPEGVVAALDDSGFASPATAASGKPGPMIQSLMGPAAASTPGGMSISDIAAGAPDAPAF